jgi:hypothetical protein
LARWRIGADVLFHHDIRRSADQDEVFDIVASHQNQSSGCINGSGIHDCEAGFAVASAHHKCSRRQTTQQAQNDQEHDQGDKQDDRPHDGLRIFGADD